MTKPKDGGPAFPERHGLSGMTLRQWYAGQAASGLMAGMKPGDPSTPQDVAMAAFLVSDALIAEDEKE